MNGRISAVLSRLSSVAVASLVESKIADRRTGVRASSVAVTDRSRERTAGSD